ncbi:MAG: PLP-dependent aminotransferase family protein [Desulfobacteraceae bacterium]|nr:PLP-dependent aminotransferase family protein [Desulfobacteraceae bacterium]
MKPGTIKPGTIKPGTIKSDKLKPTINFRYVALADEIQKNIMEGMFAPGEKLPSLRKLHNQLGLSVSTIYQAYIELEKRGRIEAREKSGFYVKVLATPPLCKPPRGEEDNKPSLVKINDLAQTILSDLQSDKVLQLGAAIPSKELIPIKQLARIMKSIPIEELEKSMANYDLCQGYPGLREAIAKQMIGYACMVTQEDIITTNGCLEAVTLCLRAVAGPGDTILVESPVFHCFLQLIEDLNMYVVELPGCSDNGIDPADFEAAVSSNKIKACLLNPNFQNPLGSVISKKDKKIILDIANTRLLPIIEDDICGDIYFGNKRPSTFKSMDTKGIVLYCSSFSKTLASGLRTGWAIPGRFKDKVLRMKLNTQLSTPNINHQIISRFLNTGAYDRHIRKLRNQIKNQTSSITMAVANHFPADTQTTFPKGGMFIWVALHKKIDTMKIYQKAKDRYISILPGIICSSSNHYKHCLRINCGIQWSKNLEKGIALLGRLIKKEYQKQSLPV